MKKKPTKFKCVSEAQKRAIRASYAKKKKPPGRTPDGRVPRGRTLTTSDEYLGAGGKTGSRKARPVVVIEANPKNELAVVPLSSRNGRNRTRLPAYQQGQSYFKHFVEIEDDENKPIRVGPKFRENHPTMDVSQSDVDYIEETVLNRFRTSSENRKKMSKFRGHKKSPRD